MTEPIGGAISDAIREWVSIVGPTHATCDRAALQAASTATFATRSAVLAIIRPGDVRQLQECMRVANRCRIAVYPISSGKNWGYGSRAPVTDAALIDLGRLNRILDYDERLAYVTIEPGVTQRQLYAFLLEKGSRLWMDATGASPDCSIIGNTLERGFGHTPLGDHCANACGFQVMLPTGDLIETGFARFPGARTSTLSRWGVGPSLDGLFSQSNLGIVTRMTAWLMPAPEQFGAFFFGCSSDEGLPAIVDALRPLRMNGTLRSVVHIANDYKVVTASGQFRQLRETDQAGLDPHRMDAIRDQLRIGVWNGSGGLYGTRAQVREARSQLRRALKGRVQRLQFVDDRLLWIMRRFAAPFRLVTRLNVSRVLDVVEPVYGLLKGVPTDAMLPSMYWRKEQAAPAAPDPDRDLCGLLWCSPAVPNTGACVADVTRLAVGLLLAQGFEPQISVSLATERTAIVVITISYDRAVPGGDQRALAAYDALTDEFVKRGYPPYRLNVRSMHHAITDAGYTRALECLKAALDPNHILAPGRYDGAVIR